MKHSPPLWLLAVVSLVSTGCKKAPAGPLTSQEQAVVGKWTSAPADSGGKGLKNMAALLAGITKLELKVDRSFTFNGMVAVTGKWGLSRDKLILFAEQVDGLTQKGIEDARAALDKAPASGGLFDNAGSPYSRLRMQEETLQDFSVTHRFALSKDNSTFEVPDEGDAGPFTFREKFVRDTGSDVAQNAPPQSQ